jgi:hypothetical protein
MALPLQDLLIMSLVIMALLFDVRERALDLGLAAGSGRNNLPTLPWSPRHGPGRRGVVVNIRRIGHHQRRALIA